MTFASVFAIAVGILMIGQWILSIAKRQIPGPEAGPTIGRGRVEMFFHWVVEFSTAIALLVGGFGLLLDCTWGLKVYLVSMGMLLYAVVNSSGYFAEKRQWLMVGMFAVILILALVSLGLVF